MTPSPTLLATARCERVRALATGPLDALASSLMSVVAIQHFAAGRAWQAALFIAPNIGYLLTPLTLEWLARRRASLAHAYGVLLWAAAAGLVLALASSLTLYVVGVGGALMATSLASTIGLALWRSNADDAVRGSWFGRVVRLQVIANLGAALLFATWMHDDAGRYRPLLAVLALGLVVAGFVVRRIPDHALPAEPRHPLASLAWLWRDRGFAWVNLSWTIMGFANFILVNLRTNWVSDAQHGLAYTPASALILITVVTQLSRIATIALWGRIFDRVNFISVRMAINVLFMAGGLLFFTGSPALQAAGSVCVGCAMGGADIVWNLWVTRYAPPDRATDYMTVHLILTGGRGVLAQILAFWLIGQIAVPTVTLACALAVAIATLMLIPEYGRGRRQAGA